MKHKISSEIIDIHPYEIVKVKLLSDNAVEEDAIKNITQQVEDYLTLKLDAVEIVEYNPPYFTIKRTKENIGFGQ